ncbi:hypothetical protein BU24DRAFT_212438 [Aaosphaeria arxii CBS 175.79]|uniref:Zn(2)-C6 fungal-type domain-containing protein n=1 Tax=Aaosphaeria arxii CBS 175.79 TaxID=1450172 RepID=A0A6A5XMU3_9PLEO|nr:uncharacterized protein BU24DRAFT_212438 [Aaosphaeria arxii CBS 175.79]KAF2014273.1 hypothetical protein BU24DRAFT_212438 [Aaosphaeria arxii CBS 175.79]
MWGSGFVRVGARLSVKGCVVTFRFLLRTLSGSSRIKNISPNMSSNNYRERRHRARMVCTNCHGRKIRCDLQDCHPNKTCGNCGRAGLRCRPHIGVRRRRAGTGMEGQDRAEADIIATATSTSRDTEDLRGNNLGLVRSQQEGSAEVSADQGRCGYIGGGSVMADASSSELISCPPMGNLRPRETDLIFRSTKALETPPPTLANALTDSFFDELFPIAPLVDRHELTVDGASHLLRQSVYFAGSLVRRSWIHAPAFSPREFYVKIKTLLFLEIEQDPMVVLRALALVGLWSSGSPKVITLNCPWQWTGEALRLASQLGLHKESSYERLGSSKGLGRRVFWGLFV